MKAWVGVMIWLVACGVAEAQWSIAFVNNLPSSVNVQVGPSAGTVPANGGAGFFSGWYPSTITVSWSGGASGSTSLNYASGGGAFVATTPNGAQASGYGGAHTPVAEWTLTFNVAPTNTLYSWSHALTNASVLAERYRLSLTYTNGVSTNHFVTVDPGASLTFSVQDTNAFTVSLDRLAPGNGIDLNQMWETEGGLVGPSSTSTNLGGGWSPLTSATVGSANVWTGSNAGSLGPRPSSITATSAGARGTNFADSATATATSDANQEKRFAELQSILVKQDDRAADREAIQAAQLLAGLDRVRDAVLSVGSHVGGALTNTGGAFMAGTNFTLPGTNTVAGVSNALRSLVPAWSAPSAVAPVFSLPLSALHDDLEDVAVNFGEGDLGEWAAMFRSFALLLVTLTFFFASLRLIGSYLGL